MKTILLISPYGKESHRWMVSSVKLAELWQRLGYRVVFCCMGKKDSEESKESKDVLSDSLTVYRKKDIFLPDPWNYGIALGFTGFVRRVIQEERPDIIVCNKILFWSSLAVIALKLTGHRVLLLTDTLVGMTWWPRGSLPRIGAAIYAWTLGWLIMLCAERIVFFHPQPESLLRRLGVWKKSEVIPTGIDISNYGLRPPAGRAGITKTDSAIRNPQSVIITYVGRLESVKGVEDFLAASVPLKRQFPDFTIQVVGWYKNDHPLVRQYRDAVTFTGLRDDIPAILAQTDIFVLPSYSEGLSNALMEAMASGCACVASDVGGNAYLIQNGVSGFLFPAGDREALAAHVRRLIEDPAKRRMLGEAARRRIEEKFSWEIVGRMYAHLFERYTLPL